jgi:hypothetical protein
VRGWSPATWALGLVAAIGPAAFIGQHCAAQAAQKESPLTFVGGESAPLATRTPVAAPTVDDPQATADAKPPLLEAGTAETIVDP